MYASEGNVQLYSNRPATNVLELHSKSSRWMSTAQADTNFQISTLWNELPLNSPDSNVKSRSRKLNGDASARSRGRSKDVQACPVHDAGSQLWNDVSPSDVISARSSAGDIPGAMRCRRRIDSIKGR